MKILKFSKLKSNRYNVTLEDGEVLKLYDDVIVKYSLIRYKEIKDEELEDLIKYNESLDAYYSALKYLTIKLRSEVELKKYLGRKYEEDIIKDTIVKLKKDGYLNRELYIKCYINDAISLSNVGPNKIRKELSKLGFFEDEFNQLIEDVEDQVWLDKLDKIISKRINSNHRYSTAYCYPNTERDFSFFDFLFCSQSLPLSLELTAPRFSKLNFYMANPG